MIKKMEYNSSRSLLLIPEYGRHVQKMIELAVHEQDREKRNQLAKAIVNVMAQLTPLQKEVADYRQKLWDHLFIISDFKLDVDSPHPKPEPHKLRAKPKKVSYPSGKIRYKHYGKSVESIIEKIKEMEDGPHKDAMMEAIANFMKMAYLNWNRDTVNDEQIFEQLKLLSDGKLVMNENVKLNHTHDLLARNVKKPLNTNNRNKFKSRGRKR